MYTSLKLSKLLAENGCEFESNESHVIRHCSDKCNSDGHEDCMGEEIAKYDILNDLCVKYAKEVFGRRFIYEYWLPDVGIATTDDLARVCEHTRQCEEWEWHTRKVFQLLQQGKQEEAEQYLWEHCLFNPKP